jgi:hypothetical protein
VPDVSQKPRVVKRAERDELKEHAHRPASGYHVNERDALEKILMRVLSDVREQRHEVGVGRPAPRTKTREAVPALVNLIFNVFPTE